MPKTAGTYHIPILAEAALNWWLTEPSGRYIDGTFGGGGHSRMLLERLSPEGRLLAFDRDADAVAHNPIDDPRLVLIHHNFAYAPQFARFLDFVPVHGVLLDLGVSSHQLDEGSRGFSYRFDAELDMRMDRQQSLTAAEVVNRYSEEALTRILETWGELPRAAAVAARIVEARRGRPILTTQQLADVALPLKPRSMKSFRFLSQLFQALRVEVNDEIGSLRRFLDGMAPLLAEGGRMVLITFQGQEDRVVKAFVRSDTARRHGIRLRTKNVVRPSWEERRRNARARSARMRVLEKVSAHE